ncbi:glycosyltransferase family 2 protein [Brenneria populi subsp. brevivirga]|uniref:glycosyltransferase family 2 protein n=1 Tax=Brenneria populi TaxID=1505588 RepID=UPI002E16EE14|nr:glycosyltransferase family 2 protein [Brenneria populi subsp. brevivirga]
MKIIAVVVFYNPEGDFFNRCLSISSQVNNLIVYDNSVDEMVINNNRNIISTIKNVSYYSEGKNNGIGSALNYAVIEARKNDFDFLITFDQDTLIGNDYVEKMIHSFNSENNIGVIGPVYKDINASRECRFPVKKGPLVLRKTLSDENNIQNVMSIITSGSLYPVPIFNKVGVFEENYFIDYIDNEFCLRLLQSGYRVCVEPKVVINHALGNRTISKAILRFSPTNYPFYRKYYITRNRLFMYKKYFLKFPSFILYDMAAFALDFIRVFLFEKDKKNKIMAYYKGVRDFLKNKKGIISY